MSTFIELRGSSGKSIYTIGNIVDLAKSSGQKRVDITLSGRDEEVSTYGQLDNYDVVNLTLFLKLGGRTFWVGRYTPERYYPTYTQRKAAVECVALRNAIEIAETYQTRGLEARIDGQSIGQASERIAQCDKIIKENKQLK